MLLLCVERAHDIESHTLPSQRCTTKIRKQVCKASPGEVCSERGCEIFLDAQGCTGRYITLYHSELVYYGILPVYFTWAQELP